MRMTETSLQEGQSHRPWLSIRQAMLPTRFTLTADCKDGVACLVHVPIQSHEK